MKTAPLKVLPLVFAVLFSASPAHGWRSSLYPKSWKPGHKDAKGRFLHDFSS